MLSGSIGRRLTRITGVVVAMAFGAPAAEEPRTTDAPVPAAAQPDALFDADGPLDLVETALVQHDVRMSLRITTSSDWSAQDIAEVPGRALCVTLAQGSPPLPKGRICVARRDGRPALSYTPLASNGEALATRLLAARVSRPEPGVLQASFLPVAAGLSVGPYGWWSSSQWIDDTRCQTACVDRLPDTGLIPARLGLLGYPPCFGAAARDADRTCDNPDLGQSVTPPPERAQGILDSYCDALERPGLMTVCGFGAARGEAAGTFAVIGDSHAASLKTALEVVSLGNRWRGISILRAACPVTLAEKPILPTRLRSRQCVTWNRQVLAWLAANREVQTVFLSTHVTAEFGVPKGRDMFKTAQAGYRDAISALLRSVRRVVVIRDVPSSSPNHLACVSRALREGRSSGPACAQRRSAALRPDPLAAAARELRSSRVKLVDLTRHFCDRKRCYPVVGGALAQRNETHLTPAFSATLGPYILRALRRR